MDARRFLKVYTADLCCAGAGEGVDMLAMSSSMGFEYRQALDALEAVQKHAFALNSQKGRQVGFDSIQCRPTEGRPEQGRFLSCLFLTCRLIRMCREPPPPPPSPSWGGTQARLEFTFLCKLLLFIILVSTYRGSTHTGKGGGGVLRTSSKHVCVNSSQCCLIYSPNALDRWVRLHMSTSDNTSILGGKGGEEGVSVQVYQELSSDEPPPDGEGEVEYEDGGEGENGSEDEFKSEAGSRPSVSFSVCSNLSQEFQQRGWMNMSES